MFIIIHLEFYFFRPKVVFLRALEFIASLAAKALASGTQSAKN